MSRRGAHDDSYSYATSGPLVGLRVLEFAGIGPAPFACTLLSDLGADVVRIDRTGPKGDSTEVLSRGRRSVTLDLKDPDDRSVAIALAQRADVLVVGFRPGVMERLGLGPADLHQHNERLVYCRMTGWGQSGPLARAAGHDLNYIALSGALHAIGPAEGRPTPPLNLVGDFGGGALYLAFGALAAVYEAQRSGKGQVVDVAMSDGAISLMGLFQWLRQVGRWKDERGQNFLDGGAPYYSTYQCADGKYIAIAAIEPEFYRILREKAGLSAAIFAERDKPEAWESIRDELASIVLMKTRDEWCELLEGTDACFAPVLALSEVSTHPHNESRGSMVNAFGIEQPAPQPQFSRTPGAIQRPPPRGDQPRNVILQEWLSQES